MKKALIALMLIAAFAGKSHATRQDSPDFMEVSTHTIAVVGYSSWTIVAGSTTSFINFGRIGLMIDQVPQNTKDIMIAITTSNVAPSSTFYGFTMTEADNPWILSIDKSRYIWAITSDILQQIIVQELK